jgi:hypothetical protein
MKAFVEILSGVVRAGPECEKYGDPFDLAVAFSSVDGKTATIKALSSDGGLTPAHARVLMKALQELGFKVTWDRFKQPK